MYKACAYQSESPHFTISHWTECSMNYLDCIYLVKRELVKILMLLQKYFLPIFLLLTHIPRSIYGHQASRCNFSDCPLKTNEIAELIHLAPSIEQSDYTYKLQVDSFYFLQGMNNRRIQIGETNIMKNHLARRYFMYFYVLQNKGMMVQKN